MRLVLTQRELNGLLQRHGAAYGLQGGCFYVSRMRLSNCPELQMLQLSTMDHNTLDQVREQIITAFASTSPSTPADLALLPEPAEGEKRHLELELQGRLSSELDRGFWLQRWSSFGSLLPRSNRYYLPSLLLLCLDESPDAWELTSGTLIVLTPRFRRLHDYGRDKRFEYQTSLITPEQQAAVCSFLGWLLAKPKWEIRSAKALKFGWNKLDHPAVRQCREFYDSLHHYTHPLVEDDEQRHLIEAIKDAFEERSYPGDDQLCGSEYGDEPAEYALEFKGLDWRTLHPRFLAYHSAALSFYADEGFAYFLPAFMIADVLGEAGNADPVFHLTHGLYEEPSFNLRALNPEVTQASGLSAEDLEWLQESVRQPSTMDWHAYALRRFSGFRPPERHAITRYLEYRAAHAWDFEAVKINAALDSYWRSSPGPDKSLVV